MLGKPRFLCGELLQHPGGSAEILHLGLRCGRVNMGDTGCELGMGNGSSNPFRRGITFRAEKSQPCLGEGGLGG